VTRGSHVKVTSVTGVLHVASWHVAQSHDSFCCQSRASKTRDKIAGVTSVLLHIRGKLYSSCVHSYMLQGSETWPVKKQNDLALQRNEMRNIWRLCGIKVTDRFTYCSKLRERLGMDDITTVVQRHGFRWYGHIFGRE